MFMITKTYEVAEKLESNRSGTSKFMISVRQVGPDTARATDITLNDLTTEEIGDLQVGDRMQVTLTKVTP